MSYLVARWQCQQIDELCSDFFIFLFRVPSEPALHVLNLLDGKLGGVQASRNLRVQISADKTAERDRGHDPEGHPGNSPEFEGGVQSDYHRRGGAQDDVKIQPVPGNSLPAEPAPFLGQGVEINQEKQEHPQHTQVYANGAAGTQQSVLGRKRPLARTERVVVESVYG